MKSHISTVFASAVVGAGLLVSTAALAQTTPAQGAPSTATGKEDINPLTGRSLSSEALARELARTKLAAELSETQVKLAKSQADLALSTLRQKADENRLKDEIRGKQPELDLSTVVPSLAPLPRTNASSAKSAPKSPSNPRVSLELRMPQASSPQASLDADVVRPMPAPPSMAAQGVIQIGGEQIQASTLANPSTTTVVAVDTQAKPPQNLLGGSSMGGLSQMGLPPLNASAPAAPVIVPGASIDAPQVQ